MSLKQNRNLKINRENLNGKKFILFEFAEFCRFRTRWKYQNSICEKYSEFPPGDKFKINVQQTNPATKWII